MSFALNAAELTAAPILDLFERYSGRFVDLDSGESVDGAQMRRQRDLLKADLKAAGLSVGDRVVFCIGNGSRFPVSLAAALEIGASPILTYAGTTGPELLRMAGAWGAAWLLTDDPAATDAAPAWLDCGVGLRLAPMPGQAERSLVGVPLHPTSGTTGLPKLALRPGPAAVAEAAHYTDTMRIGAGDRILCVTPMSHAYAYGMAVMVPLLTGADVIAMRGFNPRVAGRALAENQVTIFATVPAMLPPLQRGGWRGAPKLRLLLTAGAPLPPDVMRSFAAETGIEPCPLFGTTETGGISVAVENARTGSVGRAMAGVEARLLPSQIATDGVGHLEIRSSSMMAGYLTADGIIPGTDADRWFATGDLARIAPDGAIDLHGRVGDVINVMGHKVMPGEVETVIKSMQEVADVKVYAGRHHSGADIVAAAILPASPLDESSVRRHCEAQLAAFKRPSRIFILDAMPRTPSGKIVVRDLPHARDALALSHGEIRPSG
jgi:acyl-coenzyme A synthetase/AMP-(fatty) acid ligase